MKFFSVVLLFFLIVPCFSIEKVTMLFPAGAAYFSEQFSSTPLLLATGLIGLFGINRRS